MDKVAEPEPALAWTTSAMQNPPDELMTQRV
jgi:hypothetical protein